MFREVVVDDGMQLRLISALGLVAMLAAGWLLSNNRKRFPWRTVIWGMLTDATGAGSGTTAKLIAAFLLTSSRTPSTGDSLQAAASAFTCQV